MEDFELVSMLEFLGDEKGKAAGAQLEPLFCGGINFFCCRRAAPSSHARQPK